MDDFRPASRLEVNPNKVRVWGLQGPAPVPQKMPTQPVFSMCSNERFWVPVSVREKEKGCFD